MSWCPPRKPRLDICAVCGYAETLHWPAHTTLCPPVAGVYYGEGVYLVRTEQAA